MIRRITMDDFGDCLEIARASYEVPFDENAMMAWAARILPMPNVIGVRTEDTFGVAHVDAVFWIPTELHGAQLLLAVRNKAVWQACKTVKFMRDWCVSAMGAVDYQFGEATGMRMDVIAKRVGAVPNRPTYVYRRA